MKENLTIESGGSELLPQIEDLWYELKAHHKEIDPHFPDLSSPCFEFRKENLKKGGKEILVEYVCNNESGEKIAYCFSIINQNDFGLIESLFVQRDFRGKGIGKTLVGRAQSWFEKHTFRGARVTVLNGNTSALELYSRLGFQPRLLELMIPTKNT